MVKDADFMLSVGNRNKYYTIGEPNVYSPWICVFEV